MSELRQDMVSGAWVIIAPERGRRPTRRPPGETTAPSVLPRDPSCPFCPGNEHMLPGITEEVPSGSPPGWCARVVPNKYPALQPGHDSTAQSSDGPGISLPGYGYHEVIIETARHDADLATLGGEDLNAVVRTCRNRCVELSTRPGIRSVVVFRNHGGRAGASLVHPHSQVLAAAVIPPRRATLSARARAHYEREGRCITCDVLRFECDEGHRIVAATGKFVALVPFAAVSPFELWIMPRRHQWTLAQADESELRELAGLLRHVLLGLRQILDDPPYNYAFESDHAGAPYMHWCLRIVPSLIRPGGFEIETGLPINPSRPEDDAQSLCSAVAKIGRGGA